MLLTPGTNLDPHPKLLKALRVTNITCNRHGELFIITSLRDREHMPGSLHYVGMAFDMRTRHMSDENKRKVLLELRDELPEYDIIEYSTHYHIEVKTP